MYQVIFISKVLEIRGFFAFLRNSPRFEKTGVWGVL
nr:MAG TPA: hypothetical protein [Caudoviricetes sp.]